MLRWPRLIFRPRVAQALDPATRTAASSACSTSTVSPVPALRFSCVNRSASSAALTRCVAIGMGFAAAMPA
jgi:hypothetical protein